MSIHLQRELDNLRRQLLALGTLVEENLHRAVDSIEQWDSELAGRCVDADDEIDLKEIEIEEDCLKILALYQPVAVDLRFITSVLKINHDLERVGDLAAQVGESAQVLCGEPRMPYPFDLPGMASKVQSVLKQSLDALVSMDSALARQAWAADKEVDAIHRNVYDLVKAGILREPARIDALIHYLSISRALERAADHAANIAKDVIYMAEGEI